MTYCLLETPQTTNRRDLLAWGTALATMAGVVAAMAPLHKQFAPAQAAVEEGPLAPPKGKETMRLLVWNGKAWEKL